MERKFSVKKLFSQIEKAMVSSLARFLVFLSITKLTKSD